jgi:hypothetical protein
VKTAKLELRHYDTLKCTTTEGKERHVIEVKLYAQQVDEETDEYYHEVYEDGHLMAKSETIGGDPKWAHTKALIAWKRAIEAAMDHAWPTPENPVK